MNTPRGSHDRLLALRAPSRIDQRPSTPVVWSNDLAVNGSILAPPKIIETDNQTSLEETDYQNDDDDDDDDEGEHDDDIEIDDDNDDDDTTSQSNKSQSSWDNNTPETFHPEGNLGGWGAPVNDNWATPPTSTPSIKYSNPVSLKEVQEEQQQKSQQQDQQQQQFTSQQWARYTADTYKDDWKQSPLEYGTTHYKKNTTSGHYRNAPMVTESEGWGLPNKIIPWNDVKEQGFVKEKLEEQASTTYWNMTNGQWVDLSPAAASNSSTTAAANNSTTTANTTRKKGGIKYSNSSASRRNRPTSTQYGRRSSSSDDDDRFNAASPTPVTFASLNASYAKSKSRQRSSSVVSSDNSVDWDANDSDVVIKVHQDFPPLPKSNTGKSREPSITKWSSATEWDGKLFLM